MSDSEDESGDETKTQVERPKAITGHSDFVDISFHPLEFYALATANLNGYLTVHKCNPGEDSERKFKIRASTKPCRCLSFSSTGDDVFVLTKDRTLQTINTCTGTVASKFTDIHSSPPYSLAIIDKNLLATGDDGGTLKLWDLRKGNTAVMEDRKFDDYVSGIAVDDKHRLLFAVSGDGTMATFNARQRKFIVQSENEECDILCAKVVKDNKKVIAGLADGLMLLYNWDEFAAPSDKFPGHTDSIDHIAKVTEDIVCTASSDGKIRAVHILPNRFLGVVGDHDGMPVEKVKCTTDGRFLASCSHDSTVRFWSVEHLHETDVDPQGKPEKHKKNEKMSQSGVGHGRKEFFADFEKDVVVPSADEDSDSDLGSDLPDSDELSDSESSIDGESEPE
uniref:WD repeat-containing protein 55 n=1 Tax=Phallusia mammillata TaxID=59560 RepID=A0A6F9DXG3_9ASCI|nr:WD repeat-containing protein 55 [Phallusia mammillata]